jgi:23S rRNA (pseudouridine1915-N3)-methyltransferase
MRVHLVAIGRLKAGPERDLYDLYCGRIGSIGRRLAIGPLTLTEIAEGRAATADLRKADEADRLLKAAKGTDIKIALDARGKAMTSSTFAQWLVTSRDAGAGGLAFLMGGPDGHGPAALEAATLTLSLGPMTLPHGLARIVLAEQLYRASTIIAGHPYHRA